MSQINRLNIKTHIDKLRTGDIEAFEMIYWKYRRPLYGMAMRYLKDHELAEDAVQDIFLNLWSLKEQLTDEKTFENFLFTLLKNHALNILKMDKRRILRHFAYSEINETHSVIPEDFIFHAELRELLDHGMNQLSESKREIFRLKKLEGYSNDEIAKKLNVSKDVVKSQLYKANKFLKSFVNEKIDV